MRSSGLMCVLLGSLAWGQAAPAGSPPSPAAAAAATRPAAPASPAAMEAGIEPTAAVLTIEGVCAAQPKPAAKSTAAKPAGTKPSGAKSTASDCKTVITKAEFEKLAGALAPSPNPQIKTINPQVKRQLANVLPRDLAMAEAARKKGLENTPQFAEMLKFYKMSILAQLMQRQIQADAAKVSDGDVEKYYQEHRNDFEQYTVDRLFVPRNRQEQPDVKDEEKDEKLSADEQKAKQEAEKAKMEEGEKAMDKLAEELRTRAAAGEDFAKLQKEAFDAAGMKIASPTVTLPKLRRTGLPAAHAAVFDLKVGEVSEVINDAGGHYVYKLEAKDQMPLDEVKEELHSKLQNDHTREMMEKINGSYKVESNEAYFGPAAPGMMPGPRPMMGNRMPPAARPQVPSGPATAQPPTPPAANAPPSAPNDKQN
jgi:bifunctional DNA-binding transcriptional regulator/antitoxin component of YhaV-PrlF toxin-antitoxin module